VHCKNYKSATNKDVKDKVEAQIIHELREGNYKISSAKPPIVSAIGAIPKDTGKVRLIHDCSRPPGFNVNSYASTAQFKYQSIDTAVDLIQENGYLAKIDLSSAYRSAPIHPDCYKFTGLSWTFSGCNSPTYMYDTRFLFGASTAPEKFQRIVNTITRHMGRLGYKVICYLDDFLIIESTKSRCQAAFDILCRLLEDLGFKINWSKVVPPSQEVPFLGVQINTVSRTLSLSEEKIDKLRAELKLWESKHKATKHELQRLIGRLNWAAHVVKGGRTFLRRIIDLMCSLKHKHHHTRLNKCAKADIMWWNNYIKIFNGTTFFIPKKVVPSSVLTTYANSTMSSGKFGIYNFAYTWNIDFPSISPLLLNQKKLFAILLAARHWAKLWTGLHIIAYTDSNSVVHTVNSGTSTIKESMSWLRELFWLAAVHNFHLTAYYLPCKYFFLQEHPLTFKNCFKNAPCTRNLHMQSPHEQPIHQ